MRKKQNEYARHPIWQQMRKDRRAFHQRLVADIKTLLGCIDCGYSAHAVALDYDHIGSKKARVPDVLACSTERVLDELAQCVVRCANCHRVRHNS